MNLQHLRYFVTLANLEHYTKAAEQLHITQPTLSHAIAMIEEELGLPLFKKQGRNVILTKEGDVFKEEIQKALSIIDDTVVTMQAHAQMTIQLDIALLRSLSHYIVPNLIRDFMSNYPNHHIQFNFFNDSGMSIDLLQGVIDGKYDLAFCSKLDQYKQISYIPIAVQDMVLVVPKDHPLSTLDKVQLKDTLSYPQIWFSKRSGLRPIYNNLFKGFSDEVTVAFEVEEDETIAGLVAQQFGISILPRMDLLQTLDVDIIELDELKASHYYYLAYLTDAKISPATEDFISYVTKSFKQKK
ncbi:hypothetical protein HMPREF9318_01144 [Streptococcus urinalis FB127-CNA-2]|uniref:LysR substrate binding domain protein n=1 Tax=Streptococcus urinalis 2285-97 TaxID=764291 RepID=G5KI18_9STRE|nr:LysR family transcriptional regulator [Streptococcus urinalis]EHJ56771.1 LysR substrate binding domain protein [Streptococcus urinalis 2285-97]EKS20506.1 hypothetical protein HMPREF9318_01144 [Streptococcus urinalis FB127-CNA-2]VEF31199.1 LysR family transcriptional regulator [Streptococcus urinalis]